MEERAQIGRQDTGPSLVSFVYESPIHLSPVLSDLFPVPLLLLRLSLPPPPSVCVCACKQTNKNRHFELWSALRSDYEIDRRFDAINRKLGPMLENAKFLLDVRAEQKSSGAEWIIIFLIMLEVVMNGFGHLATFYFH